MQLLEHLKQLKSIQPDRDYTRRSRLAIIGDEPMAVQTGLRHILVHNLQYGATIAVMAVILLIVFGGSSISNIFNPFKGSALDVSSLRAEAQDVDIQVQLTKMSYPQLAISKKVAPSPTAIKKITEVIVDNKKDIEDLKATNAALSEPVAVAATATSLSVGSTTNESSSVSSDTGRIMGVAPLMAPLASSTATSTASTEATSTTSTAVQAAPKVQASSSTEITPDQLFDQLSK